MRSILLLLLAVTGLCGQRYAAADDGGVVYFSGRPSMLSPVTRVWVWNGGEIRTMRDDASLEALSYDGRWSLLRTPQVWKLLRDGAERAEFADATVVKMSGNGRWLAAARPGGLRRMEVVGGLIQEAGLLEDAVIDGRLSIADDGTVFVSCLNAPLCAWDGKESLTLPENFVAGHSGQFLFAWRDAEENKQTLLRYDRVEGRTTEMAAECPKSFLVTYAPSGRIDFQGYVAQGRVLSTDGTGRKVLLACGQRTSVFDGSNGQSTNVAGDAVLNSTFTQMLTRPELTRFAWVPLDTVLTRLGEADSITLSGPLNSRGVLTYAGEPDFTVTWGGQEMPWLRGAHGYAYAPVPRDVVAGAVDSVAITSARRPWLNVAGQVTVSGPAPEFLPLVAQDTRIKFIHGDYRGFVTENASAKRGDYLHFLISGVEPGEVAGTSLLQATFRWPPPGPLRPPLTVLLPVVAKGATEYHPSMTQVTVRIPEDATELVGMIWEPSLLLVMRLRDGSDVVLRGNGYLRF